MLNLGPTANIEDCPNVTCRVGERAPSGLDAVTLPPGFDWGDFPAPSQPATFTTAEIAGKTTAYVISMLLGIVGNVLILLIVALSKRMHSMTNFYLANLAVSDLLVSSFCMWVHMGENITPEWPFGPFVCKFNSFIQSMAIAASVFFLTVIAGDRFFAIVYPLGFRKSRKWSVVVFIITWLCAAAVATPHLFHWEMREIKWLDRHEVFCEELWPRYYFLTRDCTCLTWSPDRVIYLTLQVVLFYICPLAIICYTFIVVAKTLWSRKVPGEQTDASVQMQQKSRKKVIRMLISVLVVFIICWTPFQAIVLYDAHRPRDEPIPDFILTMKYAFTFMGYFNSSINPIIYGALNSNFQQGFKDAIQGRLCKRFHRVRPTFGTTIATGHSVTKTVQVRNLNVNLKERQGIDIIGTLPDPGVSRLAEGAGGTYEKPVYKALNTNNLNNASCNKTKEKCFHLNVIHENSKDDSGIDP